MKKSRIAVCFLLHLIMITCSSAQNWVSLNSGFNYYVRAFYSDTLNDRLYIGGQFSSTKTGLIAAGICYWDGVDYNVLGCGTSWDCITDISGMQAGPVDVITNYNSNIYIGGGFQISDGQPIKHLSKWNGSTWDSIGKCPDNTVFALYVNSSNQLLVGGVFDSIGGIHNNGISIWDDTVWTTFSDSLPVSNPFVFTICEFQGETYIGGNFSNNLAQINEIAKWDGSAWVNPGIRFYGGLAAVNAMIVYNNDLYVGGYFTASDGNLSDYIVKYNGTVWSDVGGGMQGANGQIRQFTIHNSELYAVGVFTGAGSVPAEYIAKWDGTNWCGLGTDFDNTLLAVVSHEDDLYIGCTPTIEGDTVNYIAKWTGGSFVDTCGNTTGIDETSASPAIEVYPNPTSSVLNISIHSERTSDMIYNVQNILGQKVTTPEKAILNAGGNHFEINVKEFKPGIYLIRINGERFSCIKKFIKE
jgi:trimeric autotransporter adhesin